MHEFYLVTVLKCVGNDQCNFYKLGGYRIRDKYFSHIMSVHRNDVENTFKELLADTPNEDVAEIAFIFQSPCLHSPPQSPMLSVTT